MIKIGKRFERVVAVYDPNCDCQQRMDFDCDCYQLEERTYIVSGVYPIDPDGNLHYAVEIRETGQIIRMTDEELENLESTEQFLQELSDLDPRSEAIKKKEHERLKSAVYADLLHRSNKTFRLFKTIARKHIGEEIWKTISDEYNRELKNLRASFHLGR